MQTRQCAPSRINHVRLLPYIVVIIDELSDLMMVASRDVEESLDKARAKWPGRQAIHLIIAHPAAVGRRYNRVD